MSKQKDQERGVANPGASAATSDAGAHHARKPAAPKHKITPMGSAERRNGLRNVAAMVGNLTRPLVRKRGFYQAEIILHWGQIVGPDLEKYTMPVRYNPPRGEHSGGGVLVVRVAGPVAIELQHRLPQVIDRVNTYFGYRAVEKISMIQGDISRPARSRLATAPAPEAPISPRGEASIASIEDPRLREALMRLGRHIAGAGKSRKPGGDGNKG